MHSLGRSYARIPSEGKVRAVHTVPEDDQEQNAGHGTEEEGTDVEPQWQAGAGIGVSAGNTELAFRNHGATTVSSWYCYDGSMSHAMRAPRWESIHASGISGIARADGIRMGKRRVLPSRCAAKWALLRRFRLLFFSL
jgi:hypothetical protein